MSTHNKSKDRDHKGRLRRKYTQAKWNWGTPSYWNHMYTTIPNRREEKRLTRLVVKSCDYSESDLLWPLNRRPTEYYW
jgi:hypothetical protein